MPLCGPCVEKLCPTSPARYGNFYGKRAVRRDAHEVGGRTMSLPGRKHHAADRAQRDVEAVRRAGLVVVHVVTAHRRLPLRRRKGGAGVLGLDDQVAAREGPHWAEEEGPLATEAGEHVEAGVEVAMEQMAR